VPGSMASWRMGSRSSGGRSEIDTIELELGMWCGSEREGR
jgi:hypothetical protein